MGGKYFQIYSHFVFTKAHYKIKKKYQNNSPIQPLNNKCLSRITSLTQHLNIWCNSVETLVPFNKHKS